MIGKVWALTLAVWRIREYYKRSLSIQKKSSIDSEG